MTALTPFTPPVSAFVDTHAHLDGHEYDDDLPDVLLRARKAGVKAVFVPAIDLPTTSAVSRLCAAHPQYLFPMAGLHPEEVRPDYPEVLSQIRPYLDRPQTIAVGEVGLDFYWSRDYEKEQLAAFEKQVEWSVETGLPLMIHCRKAQNEMVSLLRKYEKVLPGGVFHCFTGNEHEASQLLQFEAFALGIGGVFTFKKSHLPEVLPAVVPPHRIVIETDAPYMAPVPFRGQRNEPSFAAQVLEGLARAYQLSPLEISSITTATVLRIFPRVRPFLS